MLDQGDFIRLAYTPDLTAAGIAYARQQLPSPALHSPQAIRQRFQQLVLDKAVELAFRRYLDEQPVPYDTVPGTAFGSPAAHYLRLGGWRCNVISCWIDQPEIVRQVLAQPACLLQAAALLSSQRVVAWVPGERDVYIFTYILSSIPESEGRTLHAETIFLPGCISHPEYARRSRRLPPGSQVFPAQQARQMTRILLVSEFHPLQELLSPQK